MLYDEAMKVGKLRMGPPPTAEELAEIEALMIPKDPVMYGLRNPKDAKTTISLIDFGSGKSGVYNFVDNQWHNQLRHRRIVVRGSRGEIVDDSVIRLIEGPAITTSRIERYQLGYDLNLDGYDTEHLSFDGKVVFKNPFIGLRFMDEEIAIATLMVQMADWINGNAKAPYPLNEACQDHLVSLAIDESIALGKSVTTRKQDWAS